MKNLNLIQAREKRGLTQEAIAKKADISLRAYQLYESGERIPRADTAILDSPYIEEYC